MAAFHSMQGRIQPMWPSPPLPWVLFLSMSFLLLVFFTLVPLFIYFSVTSAQAQSSVTLCALVPCLDLSSLLALPYAQPSDSIQSGAWRCCLQIDHSHTSVFSVNSLWGIHTYMSHCWVSVLSYMYLKLRWQDALTARPSHALHSYFRNVPYTCSHGFHCHSTYTLCSSKIIIV